MENEKQELIGVEAVAQRLGLHPKTVLAYAREGILPAVRMTKRTIRFDPEAIEKWIRDGGVNRG
jgi:excisionase family DNA binding protein